MTNSAAQTLIHLDGVTKVFFTDEVETHALAGIHLEIKSGEYRDRRAVGLRQVDAAVDSRPARLADRGQRHPQRQVGGGSAALERARVRNREIGFIFQSFNLIGDLNVYENVELPLTYRGMKSAERKERVMAALEKVGMAHRAKHLPSQLSGGHSSSVSPWPAVAGSPSILLADEPTGNLDSKNGEAVELLRELHREARRSAWSRTTRATPDTPTARSTCSTAAWWRKTAASARKSSKRAASRSSTERMSRATCRGAGATCE